MGKPRPERFMMLRNPLPEWLLTGERGNGRGLEEEARMFRYSESSACSRSSMLMLLIAMYTDKKLASDC